ncbi:MAG: hypothetical protein N0A16_08580 [Blastocatellia bacterium]|nr:hypothetical protein [Blastocatellia bacterium]MCS7157769.1 hypothetical protein [Blastocatellia bacterium]MCX7753282.1 hypothetical protein [Blastocatellia bacterium]MDW8168155.1 hypothetical protein [Acidobacteriota bacterium]MDW8257597.1 hypothetical protein [Acidobacteriota bacterium]
MQLDIEMIGRDAEGLTQLLLAQPHEEATEDRRLPRPLRLQFVNRSLDDSFQFFDFQLELYAGRNARFLYWDFHRIAAEAILVIIAKTISQDLPREFHHALPRLQPLQMPVNDEQRLLSRFLRIRSPQAKISCISFGERENSFTQERKKLFEGLVRFLLGLPKQLGQLGFCVSPKDSFG